MVRRNRFWGVLFGDKALCLCRPHLVLGPQYFIMLSKENQIQMIF